MVLTRLGNKKSIAPKLYKYFPQHKMRITLFFGAGGEFFNTPRAQYNVINDLDDNVTNLYLVITNQADLLVDRLLDMPVSLTLLKHWKKNPPVEPIEKAVAFLLMSNFTYLGKGNTIRFSIGNEKKNLIDNIKKARLRLGDTRIMSTDFREVIPKISFSKTLLTRDKSFVYMDPVYLDTDHYYKVPKWTKDDTYDCFEIMSNEGMNAAMSEFDHPFVLEQAKERGFLVIPIKDRQNIKNRRKEILITNYRPQSLLF